MKVFIGLTALVGGAAAFPSVQMGKHTPRSEQAGHPGCSTDNLCNTVPSISNQQIGYTPNDRTPAQVASQNRNQGGALQPITLFDATEQYVSTTGQYAYQSPSAGDIRGPCPGLNAAANHGYLPRSGTPTVVQTITGLGECYGMSADLAGFLAAYAVFFDGSLTSLQWSIGGPLPDIGVPIVPQGEGISYSHNKYEGDSSIGRCDAYINNGDAHSLSTQRFAAAYNSGVNDRYTFDDFAREFYRNALRSEMQNPYYFAPLFSTTLVSPAAYNFVIAFMSNHTAEEPAGYLDGSIFKEFFGVTGDYPNFEWLPGQERIPNNWYRRPSAQQYNAVLGVFGDLGSQFLAYPGSFRFGGNANGVNTYEGIDLANFTNGAYNTDTLFQGNNLACFAFQSIQQGLPDFAITSTAYQSYIAPLIGSAGCPGVAKFNDNNIGKYPGHTYSPNGPATNC